jgi:hypothetical protein
MPQRSIGRRGAAFRAHGFPRANMPLTVWMSTRFTLNLRDIEALLAECGLDIPQPYQIFIALGEMGQARCDFPLPACIAASRMIRL